MKYLVTLNVYTTEKVSEYISMYNMYSMYSMYIVHLYTKQFLYGYCI